jgi:hypothetical protein
MEKLRPPKDFDLTTILFKVPVHIPKKAQTSELRSAREGYRPGELTARLQKSGLFLVRSLMFNAEYANDEDSMKFARKYATTTMLASSWHSFAEEQEVGEHGVMRRRLKLLDLTKRLDPENQLTTRQLHSEGTDSVVESLQRSNNVINAVRSEDPERIYQQNVQFGRFLGTTALTIAGASIGDTLQANPGLDSATTQYFIRSRSQEAKDEMLKISVDTGVVPSLVALAEPNGSVLMTKLKDEIPRPLADSFYQAERDLLPV